MDILANVIFPAFTAPYVSAMLFPFAGISAIAVEIGVFRVMNRKTSWWNITKLVIFVNLFSSVIGFLIAGVLPSGLEDTMVSVGDYQYSRIKEGPMFTTYCIFGFIVAFILSIMIEYPIAKICRNAVIIDNHFATVGFANLASYLTLIVAAVLYVYQF